MDDDIQRLNPDLGQLFDAAAEAYRLFGAFRVGGFTEDQALKMTAQIIAATVTGES